MATVSVFTGCEDRFPEVNPVIGEGLSRVEVKVSYEPFVTSLESRTAGDAVKSVESLYLFFYDSEQQLVKDASLFPNGYIDLSGIRFSNTLCLLLQPLLSPVSGPSPLPEPGLPKTILHQ